MTYREVIKRLGEATEAAVLSVYADFVAGALSEDEAVSVIAWTVAKANARAVAVADLSLAATIMLQLRTPVATLGLLPPPDDQDRLQKAAVTLLAVLAVTPDPEARVARLGRSEPMETAARAYSEGIKESPHVTGWTRGVSGSACELCTWYADGGSEFPDTVEMATHEGCSCVPVPSVTEGRS